MDKLAAPPSLTALIGAYEPGPGEGGLRALVPLAGAPLIEHQVRRAIAAGAGQALLIVENVPPELADVVGRLRRDGVRVGTVEDIGAAADALQADVAVLLIADACLPEIELCAEVAEAPVPALAVLPDAPAHAHNERIDASSRWAGVALIDGHRVQETAAMVGSWDPVSTLLRRAVQEGATKVPVQSMPPVLMLDAARRESAEQEIVEAARRPGRDWPEHLLFGALEERALPLLLERRIDAAALAAAALLLGSAGAVAAPLGWLRFALALLLLAGPVRAVAGRLARVRDRPMPLAHLLDPLLAGAATVAVLGLGWRLWGAGGQWGWMLLAALVPGGLCLMAAAKRIARRETSPLWLASIDALIWTLVPFALAGRWGAGLAALACYAWASAAIVLRSADRAQIL